jgi:uncharacterized membrane protein
VEPSQWRRFRPEIDEGISLVAQIKSFVLNWLQARTGVTLLVLLLLPIMAVAAIVVYVFLCVSAFHWVAFSFGPVTAALLMTAFFAAVGMAALFAAIALRNQAKRAARVAQHAQRGSLLTHPAILETALSAGRKLGWRRTIPIALLAVLGVQATSAAIAACRASDGKSRS